MKKERTGFCLFLFGFVYALNFKHYEKKLDITHFLVIFIAKF